MKFQIDSWIEAIRTLIQTGAHPAASTLVQRELGSLIANVGVGEVQQWCSILGLSTLLDLHLSLVAAHDERETKGAPAIAQFVDIAKTAQASSDDVSEFRALAGLYCTGALVWSGFSEMHAAYERINELYTLLEDKLSKDIAAECFSGLLAARLFFAADSFDVSRIGESIVPLLFDDSLSGLTKLRTAAMLMPWFEHTRDTERLGLIGDRLAPLAMNDETPLATRVIFRSACLLAKSQLSAGLAKLSNAAYSADALVADADTLGIQWIRFFAYRSAFEDANRTNEHAIAAQRLDALEALLNPADASQVLATRYRRANRALMARDFAAAFDHGKRCVDLSLALEMPLRIRLLYENVVAASLLALGQTKQARERYVFLMEKSIPGHRHVYERLCALIDADVAISHSGQIDTQPVANDQSLAREISHRISTYFQLCGGRLLPLHAHMFRDAVQRIVAATYMNGMGTSAITEDVYAINLSPPDTRPVSWPWRLRIRLFDGFTCEGVINTAAQEAGKKGDSKSTQILQYLAAHSPAAVSVQRLADALWPEAEGDKAIRSLDVALTRLRQVLPDAALLIRHDGKLSFDLNRVWCDTYAAVELIEQLRTTLSISATGSGGEVTSQEAPYIEGKIANSAILLLKLYRGPLLPDSREPFARDRATFFRAQVASAIQSALRSAVQLPDASLAEEIIRKSVAQGLPADTVRFVLADLDARGRETSQRISRLRGVFDLARG